MPRLLLLMFCGMALAGCQQSAASPGKDAGAPPPMSISVSLPVVKDITDFEEFSGRIDAVEKVEIRSRVTGYLDKIHFKPGAEVKQGDLLFTIDDKLYQSEFQAATGAVAQATAREQKMAADLERAKKLRQTSGAMSQEEFDKISAEANESTALVFTAKANLDRTQKNLAYTKISAPTTGRISRNLISEGNLVTADNTILTDIVSVDPIHIYFDVDERTILRIQELIREGKFQSARTNNNVKITMALSNDQGFPHEGLIDFVDNKIDPRLGTMWVRGIFANPLLANQNRQFTPGMFVRVRLLLGPPRKALLISDRAVGTDQGNKFVYVVDGHNKAGYRRVKLGVMHDGLRVIESGLKPEDQVIVNGILRVRPDATVAPKLIDMPVSAVDGADVVIAPVKNEKASEKSETKK